MNNNIKKKIKNDFFNYKLKEYKNIKYFVLLIIEIIIIIN